MKKTIIIFVFFITFASFAQEINEEFLASLPEGVRDDVLSQIEAREELEKPTYRIASTMIDKEERDLKGIFGEQFFDTMQSSFMPINEPNLDSGYNLDFGDVLEIQLMGQINSLDEYKIKRDGSVNIPDLGKISLAGLTLEKAINLIKARVETSFIGVEVFVSLTNIRDIQVLVTGNAFNPGIYTLSGNSNVLHALFMAGGINQDGSYRKIDLIRNNEVIETLDLYQLFIFGITNSYKRLRSGDSILVRPFSNRVSILSGVNRPGIYEMKDDETFHDLIQFGNGIVSDADLDNIQLQRIVKNTLEIKQIDTADLKKSLVKNNDALSIREYKYGSVDILGAVKIPGKYTIIPGDTLKDVLIRAGGYENFAYPFGGFLNNKRSIEINKDARERLYSQFLKNLIDNAGTAGVDSSSGSGLSLILQELRDVKDAGRVIAEFDIDAIEAKPELDTVLEDGDEIIIPVLTNQVYIYGEVNNQGAIRYEENQNINFYINGSGGYLPSADEKTIFVVHPNGKTQSLSYRNKFSLASRNDIPIFPGSIIYVPRSADITNSIQTAAIWAPIISGLALSLASVAQLNN